MKRNILYSQNRIKNKSIVNDLLSLPEVSLPSDILLEIGAGTGMISRELVTNFEDKQIKLVEIVSSRVEDLEEEFKRNSNVSIINKNFVEYQLPKEKFDVFSNIPFNYTSDILRRLLYSHSMMQVGYLVMQKEAAQAWGGSQLTEVVGETLKSLSVYPYFKCKIIHEFEKTDFEPVPNVDCVMVKFACRPVALISQEDRDLYRKFIRFVSKDRVGEGNWRVVFTNRQLDYMCSNYGLMMGRGIGSQLADSLVKVFKSFKSHVTQEKKTEVVRSI